MRTSDTIAEVASALADATAQLENISKAHKATAGKARYTYANIADVLRTVRPALASQGLAIVQGQDITDEQVVVVTRLVHRSGEWMETDCRVPVDRQGGIQGTGSALTYARRYAVLGLLGIAAEDDDGRAAQQTRREDFDFEPREQRRPEMTPVEQGLARDALRRTWAAKLRAIDVEFGGDDERAAVQAALFGYADLADVPSTQCEAKKTKLDSVPLDKLKRLVEETRLRVTLGAVKVSDG
jgi:hypothetical protein